MSSYEFTYNMKSTIGFPDMLYDVCQTYPKCDYSKKDVSLITNPRHINAMTTYTNYIYGGYSYSPIGALQPLIIVNCTDGSQSKTGKDQEEQKYKPVLGFCAFETSIHSADTYVTLKEEDPFSQFMQPDEKDNYRISYEGETNIKKIYLDLYLYNGDVNFTDFFIFIDDPTVEEPNMQVNKYILGNKIFYSITLNDKTKKEFYFTVHATKYSFYTVYYQLIREGVGDFAIGTSKIESGASYLQSIDLSWGQKEKVIKVENLKSTIGTPFLTNFYSLNCNIKVYRTNERSGSSEGEVAVTDSYGQDIMTSESTGFYDTYIYKIERTKT